jgi:hypothetical protein
VILEVPIVVSVEDAWRVLSALPPARGSAAGYDGTAVLEDADDDTLTATLRLQGAAGTATVAARAAVTVLEGRLAISAAVAHGPGGPPPAQDAVEDALGHLATTLAYALATANRSRTAWDAAVPPTPTPTGAWDAPSPPPSRPSRQPIGADAVLTAALPGDAPAPSPPAPAAPRADAPALPAPPEPPRADAPALPAPPEPTHADAPALPAPPEPGDERRWVRRGVAAAAVVAAIAVVRGRR